MFGEVRDTGGFTGHGIKAVEVQSVVRSAVRQEVERVAVPHGHGVGTFEIGDADRTVVVEVVEPDVRGKAALVTLPSAEVPIVGRVGQPFAVGRNGAIGAIGNRHHFRQATFGIDAVHHRRLHVAGGHAVSREEQRLTIGCPVAQAFGGRVVGDALGHQTVGAIQIQGVEIATAVVVAHEGDGGVVRAEARQGIGAGRRRDGHGGAAVTRNEPDVIRVDEHDVLI